MNKSTELVVVYLILLIIWSMYRYFFNAGEVIDELVAKPILQLLPVCMYLYVVEKKRLKDAVVRVGIRPQFIAYGVMLGSLLVAAQAGTRSIMGNELHFSLWTGGAAAVLFISFVTAVIEESVFRGFFQQRLSIIYKSDIGAVFGTSVLFAIFHLPVAVFVLKYSGIDSALYILLVLQTGALLGLGYALTGSLTVSILAHTLWNSVNGLFL